MCNTRYFVNPWSQSLKCGTMQQHVCECAHWARFTTKGGVRTLDECYCFYALLACLLYPGYGVFTSLAQTFAIWPAWVASVLDCFSVGQEPNAFDICFIVYVVSIVAIPLIFLAYYVYGMGYVVHCSFKFRTVPVVR